VLQPVRARGGYELSRFQLVDHGRILMNIDYRQLPPPLSFLFSVPQRHILEELHAACRVAPGFRQMAARTVHTLLRDDAGRVTGVRCGTGEEEQEVQARCVVAADGRYSRVRKLAAIEYQRREAFEHDVLWFKLPAPGRAIHDVRVFRDSGSPVLIHDSYPDRMQLGWTLPHGGYKELASRGIAEVREAIAQAVPPYAELVREHVQSLNDLTLLDVFAGVADQWSGDGLLLIGDAAHTHGPIGAQGINLALQDAAVAHEVLIDALHRGDFSNTALARFESRRRPAVNSVMVLQERQAKGMLAAGPVTDRIRPVVTALLAHTPVFRKVLEQIAFGDRTVHVHDELFVASELGNVPG
jgi:monooxygenase